jgi:tetratricopeptide (TPR) repeat protein
MPDGRVEWLIDIHDWDFRWQDVYRYTAPLRLPRGTILEMEYTYDNSTANPRNPNRPPRRVTFGQTTASEMGDLWLQMVTVNRADRAILDRDYAPKMLQEDIAGDETILGEHPRDVRLRMDLAFCYQAAGRTDEATAQLRESLDIEPDSVDAHYELGTILLKQKRLDEAERHFRRVIELKPDFSESYNNLGVIQFLRGEAAAAMRAFEQALQGRDNNAEARFNLGRVLVVQKRTAEAVAQFNLALRLKPDDAETHASLASALATLGDVKASIGHYRDALRLKPDLVSALADLAWILASADDPMVREPHEAVQLSERAARLTNSQNAVVLDTLALSYFAAGRVDDAVRVAQAAVSVATASGDVATADAIATRLRLYERGRPQ